jgi:hypothetical protein
VIVEALNKSPSYWITLKLLGYKTKYVEHNISLNIEGRPTEIRGTTECIPYNVADIGNLAQLRYVEERQAITRRLDDGRGLIIVVPNLCYKPIGTVADNWRPILGLVDTANDPSFLQLFIVPDSPAARMHDVQFVSLRSSVTESKPQTGPEAPFAEWRTRKREASSYDNRFSENALAVFGWNVTRSELARVYNLSEPPDEMQVRDIAAKDPAGSSLTSVFSDMFERIYRGLEGDVSSPIISSPTSELETERRIIPFRFADGTFVPSPDDRGSLLFYFEPFLTKSGGGGTTSLKLMDVLDGLHRRPDASQQVVVKDHIDLDQDVIVFSTRQAIGSYSETEGGEQ